AKSFRERVWNLVHAADGLKHRHLLIEAFLEYGAAPEIRIKQCVQFKWRTSLFRDVTRSGQLRSAGSFGALIGEVLLQVTERAEKCEKAVMILFAQTLIQRTLIDALREQFGDMSTRVIDDLTLLDWFSIESLRTRHQ